MKPNNNGLIVVDLNVFAHFIKDELEKAIQPISNRYNTRAVAKAKADLAEVRRAREEHKSTAKMKAELERRDLPATVKEAQAALRAAKKLQSDEQSVIQAAFVWLVSGEWLGPLRDEHNAIAFVGDLKCGWFADGTRARKSQPGSRLVNSGYWRHWYLMQPEVYEQIPDKAKNKRWTHRSKKALKYMTKPLHYKSGRKFPSNTLGRVRKELYRIIKAKGFPLLWSKGDEADDHAALLVRVNEQRPLDRQRPITLLTTDGDWTQLIGPSTRWFCMYGHYPRLRATVEDLNRWKKITGADGDLRKISRRYGKDHFKTALETPEDIIEMKCLIGDDSDALPPGSPREVIDLRNPPAQFDLVNDQWAIAGASEVLNMPERNLLDNPEQVESAKKFLRSHAIKLPIRTYEPEKH